MVAQNTLRTRDGKWVFSEDDCKFATDVVLNKRLKQIKLPILLNTCAPISELTSNISTMFNQVEIMILQNVQEVLSNFHGIYIDIHCIKMDFLYTH